MFFEKDLKRDRIRELKYDVSELREKIWELEEYLGVERGYKKEKKED